MTSSSSAAKADPKVISDLKRRRRREQEILAGDLPSTRERLTGLPPLRGSEADDRRVFLQQVLSLGKIKDDPEFVRLVEQARDDGSETSMLSALAVLEQFMDFIDITTRLRLILAASGHSDSLADLSDAVEKTIKGSFRTSVLDHVYADAMIAGLNKCGHIEGYDFATIIEEGLGILRRDAARINGVDAGIKQLEKADEDALADEKPDAEVLDELVALALEDRAECAGTGLVVVPKLNVSGATGGRKDIVKSYEPIGSHALPIIEPTDLPAARSTLLARFPHFVDEVDTILRQRRPMRVLLVGSPGCGKTALARAIGDALGVQSVIYSAGGTADSSFAGTSAQWSTARTSTPLQLVHRARVANPVVILDELEKAGTSRHNGSLVDSLLSFLEPSSARRILDPALEVEVDLSAVSYIATANDLDGVPAPLKDRFKIVRMPDPEWRHVGDLVRNVVDDIASERDLDRRWIGELAQDELELVRKAWPSGSLRKLRRVVELIIDGRETFLPRA